MFFIYNSMLYAYKKIFNPNFSLKYEEISVRSWWRISWRIYGSYQWATRKNMDTYWSMDKTWTVDYDDRH